MQPGASAAQIQAVERRLEQATAAGLHLKRIDGKHMTVIAAVGDADAVREMGLEGLDGVDRVVEIQRPYKLASNEVTHAEPSRFALPRPGGGEVVFGPEAFVLIAGPCTVESREQTLTAARACAAAGASMLRAGIFKPRTSPFAFQGPGEAGLEILREAREETGLGIVSEAKDARQAELLAGVADMIQIGARNMQNYELLAAVGELGAPVLLKRGLASTLDELLMAADYVLNAGSERVVLCERGIRTFEPALRFTLDLGAVPYLKAHTHLPVIIDPSHAPGDRRFVGALARAAAAVGADGIIVEVTDDPEAARCDGPQQLYASDFADFARGVAAHAELEGRRIA